LTAKRRKVTNYFQVPYRDNKYRNIKFAENKKHYVLVTLTNIYIVSSVEIND